MEISNTARATVDQRLEQIFNNSVIIDLVNPGIGGSQIYNEFSCNQISKISQAGNLFASLMRANRLPFELAVQGQSEAVRDWWDASGLTAISYQFVDLRPEGVREAIVALERHLNHLPWLSLALTAEDFRRAKSSGEHAYYGYCQPVLGGIPNDLACLDAPYEAGLRMLMLTYNRMDYVGCGCTERVDAGLSMFGSDVVAHCNARGILVDVSHCGRQTTLDACRIARAQVSANHTGAAAVYSHVRNKSDDELKAIADTGGVIGIYMVPFFLTNSMSATFEDIFNHLEHIAGLVGWKQVALGSDWPIQAPSDLLETTLGAMVGEIGFRPEDNVGMSARIVNFEDFRSFPNFVKAMIDRGYTDEQIAGFLGENFLRVFEAVCG